MLLGLSAESTYSQGNSGVVILGVNIMTSSKATITPSDFLSKHFQVRDFLFKKNIQREIYLTLVPCSCVLNTSVHSAVQDLKTLCLLM